MDNAPKPKDPEIIAGEKICQEMREVVRTLPPQNNAKRGERHEQFQHTFCSLFKALKIEKSGQNYDLFSNNKRSRTITILFFSDLCPGLLRPIQNQSYYLAFLTVHLHQPRS